eukprot:748838-Hanusia_phi.AAC.9
MSSKKNSCLRDFVIENPLSIRSKVIPADQDLFKGCASKVCWDYPLAEMTHCTACVGDPNDELLEWFVTVFQEDGWSD